MKRNLILLWSLFAATALISSCAQDAMEPEVDAAATVAETRAYGDKTPKVMMYIEVNDTNPLNALEFVLKDSGKLFFDDIILFSANINYNAETGRVYVLNNPNVQFLLDAEAASLL